MSKARQNEDALEIMQTLQSSQLTKTRGSCSQMFYKKGVKKSTKFTRNHECRSLFLTKLQVSNCNFIRNSNKVCGTVVFV